MAETPPTKVWFLPLTCAHGFDHSHTFMITLLVDHCNPISQDFYDNTINSLQFHQLTCSCGLSGGLLIHAYYERGLKLSDGLTPIRICRLICSHCKKTHALLLSSFVPYSQISLPDQVEVISTFEQAASQSDLMERNNLIDENNIRWILRQYLRFWKQRLLTARISLSSPSLTPLCLSFFGRQFMQIKNTPNLFFASTT